MEDTFSWKSHTKKDDFQAAAGKNIFPPSASSDTSDPHV